MPRSSAQLKPQTFVDETFGLPTVTDILRELEKPGRDPRPAFKTAVFKDGVETIKDLRRGMILEGIVTNVAAFGAFVDIGVHQDGLVHISAMSQDLRQGSARGRQARRHRQGQGAARSRLPRKRIALTMRLDDEVGEGRRDCEGRAARKVECIAQIGQRRSRHRLPAAERLPRHCAAPARRMGRQDRRR